MQKEVWQEEEVAEGEEPNQVAIMVKTGEWEAINSASALWTRNKERSD